jgi:hypothetical protein
MHNFAQKCQNCKNYKKLFPKLKEHEEQSYQLKQQINFARQHRLHKKFNQIKSVDTQLKTGITESLCEPLMKIVQKLLISDKATFDLRRRICGQVLRLKKSTDFLLENCLQYQNSSTTGHQFQDSNN